MKRRSVFGSTAGFRFNAKTQRAKGRAAVLRRRGLAREVSLGPWNLLGP